jgi:S1/P1 Nuclease
VRLTYFQRSMNLHAVWDEGIIEQALHVQLAPNYAPDLLATRAEAARLDSDIAPAAAAWAPTDLTAHLDRATVQWANESHTLAQTAYLLPRDPQHQGWDETYQDKEWPVVETQLLRAGLRLAELLNEELH